MEPETVIADLAAPARRAAAVLAASRGEKRNAALLACAQAIRDDAERLKSENNKDLSRSEEFGLSQAMVDRLTLDDGRIESMACALEQIAAQTDPIGQTIRASNRPNGLRIEKRRVPIGVIGIIFESRPNVTADAAGLCIKSGNACILRGGKEAIHSNLAIAASLRRGLAKTDLPPEAVTVLESTDRALVAAMARAEGLIDLIIPRGGEALIRAVAQAATIPVIKHYAGNCHVYVHARANLGMAERIVMNAKCQRPGVCNAAETLLVDQAIARRFLGDIAPELAQAGVELRGCDQARTFAEMKPAVEEDWSTEYLELILAVKVVEDLDEAIEHINTYSSGHTEAVVTDEVQAAQEFISRVDSSSVMVNASTRFSDGGEYGLGAEIGISTDKLHARGPMGAEDLTTYKWIVTGQGHVRQ
ncbi:MAG: glutamate-5-semialdehyde dehydrogenase [Phycisphaerae bacterium]|jgi:glutamate-5-semialdehyde dehydrogenase|nr:glutamate-5-semialdehyde dehydrogenase [Phycisphaerae bacterium]